MFVSVNATTVVHHLVKRIPRLTVRSREMHNTSTPPPLRATTLQLLLSRIQIAEHRAALLLALLTAHPRVLLDGEYDGISISRSFCVCFKCKKVQAYDAGDSTPKLTCLCYSKTPQQSDHVTSRSNSGVENRNSTADSDVRTECVAVDMQHCPGCGVATPRPSRANDCRSILCVCGKYWEWKAGLC